MKVIPIDRNDPRQRRLARLILGRNSIQSAEHAARYIVENIKEQKHPLFSPLEAAAVICYARPFTTGGGRIPGKFAKIPEPTLQSVHDELISHRHKSIAHSDEDLNLVVVVPPGKRVKAGNLEGVTNGFGVGARSQTILLPVFPAVVALCKFQIDHLNAEIEEKVKELESVFLAAPQTEF